MSNPFTLPQIPKEKDYEEYIAAFLQAGGLYVERNAIYREQEELLELDILTTQFDRDNSTKNLIEIKSGDWSFGEIFKVRGWLTYLNLERGIFVVQKQRDNFAFYVDKAITLGIDLIDNSNLAETVPTLTPYLTFVPDVEEVQTIRLAFYLERKQLEGLKKLKRNNRDVRGYAELDQFYYQVNSETLFFSPDPITRIGSLFSAFKKNRNITAKISHEINGGDFDDDVTHMRTECWKKTFWEAEYNVYQVSLLVEHLNRVTILKASIEHLIEKLQGNYDESDMQEFFKYMVLPANIQSGLAQIINDPYFHLYPMFWQWYTYVFGGFILEDFRGREYAKLAAKTGIPEDEIPNAFAAFDKLFPIPGGWQKRASNTSITSHRLFPIALSGVGANYRLKLYTDDRRYSTLAKSLSMPMSNTDLVKWNNLAYQILTS